MAEPSLPDAVQEVPASMFALLQSGAMVLTANQRAAHSIRQGFNRDMLRRGLTRWQPVEALALETWLSTCWNRLILSGAADRLLLNSTQEHALWRAVIAADDGLPSEKRSADSADALATLAAEAWRQLHLAQGRGRLEECASSSEGQAFMRWTAAFENRLHMGSGSRSETGTARLLTAAQLPQALVAALRKNLPAALGIGPAGLALVDVDIIPAATASLLEVLRGAGCPVIHIGTDEPARQAELYPAQDEPDEVKTCAIWVRGLRERSPQARIAVVVPGLGERRANLERVFAAALEPATLEPATLEPATLAPAMLAPAALAPAPREAEPPYEFSLGQPLTGSTLVASALSLLRWVFAPLPLAAISALLRSPYLTAGEMQAQAAAEFDAFELRQRDALRDDDALRPELTLSATITALDGSDRRPRLLNLIYRLRSFEKAAAEHGLIPGSATAPATYTLISAGFRTLLNAVGCAPPDAASSAERQLWQAWESALDELATLDVIGAIAAGVAPSPQVALAEITRLTSTRLFAPQTQSAPVQIVGPLELGCVRFDALWFMGADDLTWPPLTDVNPLLPWRLQNALSLPGADRVRDRQLYSDLTARLAGSATEVIFSYAAEAAEGRRRPSPLLAALRLTPYEPPPPQPSAVPLARTSIPDVPPPTLAFAAAGLRGGAKIFELQAACAFRAFAELRAFSTGLDTRETGMNALERGNLVHRTMELFWKRVADQQVLIGLTAGQRQETLDACIVETLAKANSAATHRWDQAYLEIQRQRLHELLTPWLEIEAARPAFAVLQQETKLELAEIGGLRIRSLRVDRIDETEGGLLILDYKTGPANPRGWLSERPEKPQLPLYAAIFVVAQARAEAGMQPVIHEGTLAGVAYANLRPGKGLGLCGFSDEPAVLAKSAPMDTASFEEQIAEWHRILTDLAAAFISGDARVLPRAYPRTCAQCGQRLLCRLKPAMLPDAEEDEAQRGGADDESEAETG